MAVSTIDALYNGTSEKLTTSATGITVTGTVAATAYTGDGSALTGTGSPSIDDNGNATAMTIDSSENVLVGKAATDLDVAGSALFNTGQAYHTRSGNTALYLNRLSSDGTIADFRKDGTTVGSIATQGSRLSIGSGDVNLNFNASANSMYPISDPAAGTLSSGIVDLGAALATFKDAYLSGGVYLGGTGSANKLDDVETGTFTAGVSTGTIGGGDGTYVKVGDLVYCGITIGNFSNTSSGNPIVFTGLPFASHSANQGSNGSIFCRYISGGFPDAAQVSTSATTGRMWKSGSTAFATVNHNDITNGTNAYFFIGLTYRAA